MNPAKQAAIELIEYYVKRGDSLKKNWILPTLRLTDMEQDK